MKHPARFFLIPLLTASLWVQPIVAQPGRPVRSRASSFAPWTFDADFGNGIPGWLSFPLAQDEGFDPSLYTSHDGAPALVRDVVARGQKILRVGLLKPLRFHATPSSVVTLSYALDVGGPVLSARVILAGPNGQTYSFPIPAGGGTHAVRITGGQFGLPGNGVTVDAMVVEAEVAAPILGSHNRLTLRGLKIVAERPPSLALAAPQTVSSRVSGVVVAQQVATREAPLEFRLGPGPAGHADFYDGSGRLTVDARIPKNVGSGWQMEFPPSSERLSPGLWSVKIQRGARRQTVRFLVLGQTPPHPRILLGARRLAQLRSHAALVNLVRQQASQLRAGLAYNSRAGVNITLLSPDSVFPGLPQYFQLMEAYSRAIAYNALDFQLTGDPLALDGARKALATISEWPTWTPPWFSAHGLRTYYEVGVFTQRVAFGYDLIADQLSPVEKSSIATALWQNSIQPTLEDYYFNDRLPVATSNHMANSVGGAIAACVALEGDVPDWNSRFGPALAELITADESLLKGLFPGDGSEAEPAGYEDFAMEGISWGAAALQALGIRPAGAARMLRGFWWLRYARFTPEQFLDTGDFDGELQSLSGFAWGAEHGNNADLRAFYGTAATRTVTGFGHLLKIEHTGRRLEAAPGLLDLVCCTMAAAPVPTPPDSRIFALRGSAVMRSGWGPGSTVISLRVGPWFNHEHHDEGSFQAAVWGEKLIAEAGYSDYYKDPRYADYFSQAPGHNNVLLDGDAFSQEDYDGRTWRAFSKFPRFRDHVFSEGMDYISANLAPAYNDGGSLDRYSREYIFLKPDILVIHDRLDSHAPHRYTFLLHLPPGDVARIDNSEAVIRGRAAFAALAAGGVNHQWAIDRAPVPVTAYGNLDRDAVEPRQTLRLDTPFETSTDFGVAMRFQRRSETPAPLTAFKTISGFGFKSEDGHAAVLLRTSPGLLVSHHTPFGDVSCDGDVVAVTRDNEVQDVLAVRANELRLAGRLLFSVEPSTSKVDMILHQDSSGEHVYVSCSRETNLQVGVNRRPLAVDVDGSGIAVLVSNGFVSVPRLAKGEHVVSIRY